MKWFFGIFSFLVLAAVSIGVPPILSDFRDAYEEQKTKSIDIVETALLETSSSGMEISIYAPSLQPISEEVWELSGVYVLEGVGEFQARGPFRASLTTNCLRASRGDCWWLSALHANGQTLVRGGEQVAALKLWESPVAVSNAEADAPQTEDRPGAQAPRGRVETATASEPLQPESDAAPVKAAGAAASDESQLTLAIQERLAEIGHYRGPKDGLFGPRTRAAIRSYQESHDMARDGEISEALLDHLNRTLAAQQAELNDR